MFTLASLKDKIILNQLIDGEGHLTSPGSMQLIEGKRALVLCSESRHQVLKVLAFGGKNSS